MTGYLASNVDHLAVVYLLGFALPIVWLFGMLFGFLSVISAIERMSRRAPLVLGCLAILSTLVLLVMTARVDRGFNSPTLIGLLPAVLGISTVADRMSKSSSRHLAGNWQLSLRVLVNVTLVVAVVMGAMACLERASENARRAQKALRLVSQARVLLATPSMCSHVGEFGVDLIVNDPSDAVSLCSEAITLLPENGEAYDVRAVAYDRMGDRSRARRDRERARQLGYHPSMNNVAAVPEE